MAINDPAPSPPDQNVVSATTSGLVIGSLFGLTTGICQNYYDAHMVDPLPKNAPTALQNVLRTTGTMAALSGTYMGVKTILRDLRGKKDMLNGAVAGCAAGSVVAVKSGRVATGGVACVCFAVGSLFSEAVGTLGSVNNVADRTRRAVYSPKVESGNIEEAAASNR